MQNHRQFGLNHQQLVLFFSAYTLWLNDQYDLFMDTQNVSEKAGYPTVFQFVHRENDGKWWGKATWLDVACNDPQSWKHMEVSSNGGFPKAS